MQVNEILTQCLLCEKRALQIIEQNISQCLNCGYVTTEKFEGTKESCEEFKKLPEDMQKMAVEKNNFIWIPSVVTLPNGVINPVLVDSTIFWAFSPSIKISKEEQINYPDDKGGFFEYKYDREQTKLFKDFFSAIQTLSKNNNGSEKTTL